ncbi:hypothetical protein CFB03_12275 [Salmonella enterica subsp. enterica serovar Typhimurium]|nr:hypothetical protein CFB03_12275 [Salmonella enterica subsp. enterica serovar Typhimurium]
MPAIKSCGAENDNERHRDHRVHVLQRVAKFQECAPKIETKGKKNRRAMTSVMAGSSALR